eukprot:g33075.t1
MGSHNALTAPLSDSELDPHGFVLVPTTPEKGNPFREEQDSYLSEERPTECGIPHLSSYRRWSSFITKVKEVVGRQPLIADVTYRNIPLRLINVYALVSQGERLAILQQLPLLLVMSRLVILAGDFNCIIN